MFGGLFALIAVVGCLTYTFFALRPCIERDAREHFNHSAQQLERSMFHLLHPPQLFIKAAAEWAAVSTPGADLDAHLNRLFLPLLQNSSPITSVVAGTPEGQGYMLLQQPEGGWLNRLTDIEARGSLQRFIQYAPDGTKLRSYTEKLDYDPRQRPWFQAAMQTPQPEELCWTSPYELFTTKDLGITLSTRVEKDDGGSIVLGLDVMLRDISEFTSTHRVGTEGFMLVMTESQRLIGFPPAEVYAHKPSADAGMKTVESLNSHVVEQALARWDEDARPQNALYRFSAAGQDWYGKISPFQLGDNKRFWIAMFAPRHEFAPAWYVVASYIFAVTLVILGLVLLATRRMAQKLAAPIASVAADSEAIARLDFRIPQFNHCSIREIERLVCSHTQMSTLIQESLTTVEAQKQELSRNVEELQATRDRLREKEVKLQQNLNYIQGFFDSPLMGIAVVHKHVFTDCNRTFCALTGYSPSEVKGMPTRNLYANEEDYARVAREAVSIFEDGNIYTTEIQIRSRNGSVNWARISGCLFDRNDPDKGRMWIAIPIPERDEAGRDISHSVSGK
jgi:PAS domain S-box-containing protein